MFNNITNTSSNHDNYDISFRRLSSVMVPLRRSSEARA